MPWKIYGGKYMKKINKITLKELLDSTDLLMHLSDILYFVMMLKQLMNSLILLEKILT